MTFRFSDLVRRGMWAGLLLGFIEAVETIVDGFLAAYGPGTHALFVMSCVLLMVGSGAILGAVCWGISLVIPRDVRERVPARVAWSVFIAGQLALVTFLYGFKLLPMWGIGVLPSGGLFNPVLPGTVGLIVVPIVVFVVASVGLYRWCRRQLHRFGLTLGVALLLYWQVSYGLYAMSRIAPADKLHALSLVMLLALVMLLVPFDTGGGEASAERGLSGWAVGLIAIGLVMAPVIHHVLGAYGSHTLRLLMHERTALSYRVLESLPATYSTDPLDGLSVAPCEGDGLEVGEQGEPGPERAAESVPTVRGLVFIMVDALRGDLIGARREAPDGTMVELTPNLNALAERSIWFENTYSTAAVTRLSAASMLTGRYSDVAEIGRDEDSIPTIASELARDGVRTVAVPVHPILESALGEFDLVDETLTSRPEHRFSRTARRTVDRVNHHLARLGEEDSFFVFAHFYDPHWYYVPNDRFYFGPTEHDRYHAEVASTDFWIGRLIEHIESSENGDDVAIVVVGDHGEEFWDHKYIQHVVRLYDESIRVPVIVQHPSLERSRRVTEVVSTVDVAPTILELFGLRPRVEMKGRALLADAVHERVATRPVHAAAPGKHAVIRGRYKLIVDTERGILELYDLDDDPGEHNNLADHRKELLGRLTCQYRRRADSRAFAAEF
ncbi:MAG: sulfatase [Myxococcota bacterium]